jgi:hypothetical protein
VKPRHARRAPSGSFARTAAAKSVQSVDEPVNWPMRVALASRPSERTSSPIQVSMAEEPTVYGLVQPGPVFSSETGG